MQNGRAAEESAQLLQSPVGFAESLGRARRHWGGLGPEQGVPVLLPGLSRTPGR